MHFHNTGPEANEFQVPIRGHFVDDQIVQGCQALVPQLVRAPKGKLSAKTNIFLGANCGYVSLFQGKDLHHCWFTVTLSEFTDLKDSENTTSNASLSIML